MRNGLIRFQLFAPPFIALALVASGGSAASAQSISDALLPSLPPAAAAPARDTESHLSRAASVASRQTRNYRITKEPRRSGGPALLIYTTSTSSARLHEARSPKLVLRRERAKGDSADAPLFGGLIRPGADLLPAHARTTQKATRRTESAQPSLDSMTRDGDSTSSSEAAGQGIDIGGAIVRWCLSLALVLALCAGAISYLRKKGFGVPIEGGGGDRPAVPVKPIFGMSPLAQMLMRRQAPAKASAQPHARAVAPTAGSPAPAIDNLHVLSSGALPGSNYMLYKIRVDDRVMLLAGAPGAALSLLAEWDGADPPQDDRRFDAMLDQLANCEPIGMRGSGLLKSAAERLEMTTHRVASLGRTDRDDES